MRKITALFFTLIFVFILFLCTKLERDNPFDPEGDEWSPPSVQISINDTTISIYDTISITASANDNGAVVKYHWYPGADSAVMYTDSGVLRYAFTDTGVHLIRVKVRDDDSVFSKPDSITVTVLLNPPTVISMNDTTVSINDTLILQAVGSDTNGFIVKYLWALDGVQFNDTTDTSCIPVIFNDSGNYRVQVKVLDDDIISSLPDSTSIQVVLNVPVADAGNDTTVGLNDTIPLHGTGTDTNGIIINYLWKFGSSEWVITSTGDTAVLAPSTPQTYVCSLRVMDDDSLFDYDELSVTVESSPPTADAGSDTTVGLNDSIQLSGTGTDIRYIVKYEWKFGNNPWVETSSGDTTILAPSTAQTYICSLKVTDDDGEVGMDYITVTVASNQPSVNACNDTTVGLNDPVYLYGTATDNGSIVKYEWKFGNNPWVETDSTDTIIISPFTAQEYICSLKVTDDDGEVGVDFATITIESNPPVVETCEDTTVGLNDPAYLYGTATDNGSIVKYEWKIGDNPWVETDSTDTNIIVPSTAQLYICSLKVTDDDGEVAKDFVTITIGIDPPVVNACQDTTVGLNDLIYLYGTAMDNGSIVKYEWKFGGNPWIETDSTDTNIIAPSTAQEYVCCLKVTDNDGEVGADYVTVTVESFPPVVFTCEDTTVGLNDSIHLYGTASDNGSIAKYEWKFGNNPWVETDSIDTIVISPSTAQAYICSLKVTDDDEEVGMDYITVTVESNPPSVSVCSDTTVALNEPIHLYGTASDNGSIVKYEWKFGNNPWVETSSTDTNIIAPSEIQTYVCSLKVTDDDGEESTDYLKVYTELLFQTHIITTSIDNAPSFYVIDLDNDNDIDVVASDQGNDELMWFENDGSQNFTYKTILSSVGDIYSLYAIDVDGDNDIDVLSAGWNLSRVTWYENDGSENFTARVVTSSADLPQDVFAIDLDEDNDIDVLSASVSDDKIAWYENDGTQNFTPHTITTLAVYAHSVFAIDLDEDNDIDVLSASANDGKIAWYENNGNENFSIHTITTDLWGPYTICAADIDGDLDLDVLSCGNNYMLGLHKNDGSENFTADTIIVGFSRDIYPIDVDGDGNMDVLSANGSGEQSTIAWFRNDGSENFTNYIINDELGEPRGVYGIDMDKDGDVDVLSVSNGKIAWYENLSP